MRFRNSLRRALLVTMTLPFLMLGAVQYRTVGQQAEREGGVCRQLAALIAQSVQGELDKARGLLASAAGFLAIEGTGDPEKLARFLEDLRRNCPAFLNIHFDSPEGRTLAFSPRRNEAGESNVGVDHTGRVHWRLMTGPSPKGISEVFPATGAASVPIVNLMAASHGDGVRFGYAVCALDLKRLSEEALASFDTARHGVWIADGAGHTIYSTLQDAEVARAGAEVVDAPLSTPESEGFVRSLPTDAWRVGVFLPKAQAAGRIQDIGVLNGCVFLTVLALTLAIARATSRPLTEAVSRLASQVRAGRSDPREDERVENPSEIADLQREFGALTTKLGRAHEELSALNAGLREEVDRQVRTIHEQMAVLDAVLGSMTDGVLLAEADGTVVFANARSEEMLGKGPLAGRRVPDVLQEAFRSQSSVACWLEGEPVRLLSKAGGVVVDLITFPIGRQGGAGRRGILLHDTTAQESIARVKDELIGVVAHELKSPLAAVKLQAELLSHGTLATDSADYRTVVSDLREETDRLQLLIGNWLDVSRLDAGAYTIERRATQIKPIISRAARSVRPLGDFDLSVEIDPEAECCFVDRNAFVQVFVNLMGNAVRYARAGVKPAIRVRCRRQDACLRIDVSDNGVGIAPEHRKRIFDRFYQVDMGATRRPGGTGLGLVITESLVRLHGGTITVDSVIGAGTTFTILLPEQGDLA